MTVWKELVQPIVRKCRLAATLNMDTKCNATGSLALAKVLEDMADLIDTEIAARSAAETAVAVIEGRA